MKKQNFLTAMFVPLALLVFSLAVAFGAAAGGYDEQYALWVSYSIALATATVLMVEHYNERGRPAGKP